MRITESAVLLTSGYSYTEVRTVQESLRVWRNGAGENSQTPLQPAAPRWGRNAALPGRGRQGVKKRGASSAGRVKTGEPLTCEITGKDRQKIIILEKLLEALTRKKIKILIPKLPRPAENSEPAAGQPTAVTVETAQNPAPRSWGLEYSRIETYRESEQLTFAASGFIKTADGMEIAFTVELNMSREFAMVNGIKITAGGGKPVDPLVINYSGKAAELTETRFRFDLDSDGREDLIPFLQPGSGFLVLDPNNDGIVRNGSQLFGPATGDGFAELAAYDSDNNDWIDAADPVFAHLRIWTRDEDGNSRLFALGEKGIGAVYLGSITAPFQYKDEENRPAGKNQQAGIFVRADGTVGTVQQIDLIV